jgi:hypothetical protein
MWPRRGVARLLTCTLGRASSSGPIHAHVTPHLLSASASASASHRWLPRGAWALPPLLGAIALGAMAVQEDIELPAHYDVLAIQAFWNARPGHVVMRAVSISKEVLPFAIQLWRDQRVADEKLGSRGSSELLQERAVELREMLTRLGPTFIKVRHPPVDTHYAPTQSHTPWCKSDSTSLTLTLTQESSTDSMVGLCCSWGRCSVRGPISCRPPLSTNCRCRFHPIPNPNPNRLFPRAFCLRTAAGTRSPWGRPLSLCVPCSSSSAR